MSLTDTGSASGTVPYAIKTYDIAMADACNLIQRMSSCITASVVKTTLLGLRKFVVKAIIFENSLRLCSR